MKRKINLLALLGFLLAAASLQALTPDEWKYRQSLEIDKIGPIKFSLPPATLDVAQPDLRDLRVIDATGKEIPYLLLKPAANVGKEFAPTSFRAELSNRTTILTIETGSTQPLDFVDLETSAKNFIKPVQIELSADGETWRSFDRNIPIFRQEGAAKTTVSLGQQTAAFVRLTVSDERDRPIAITGAKLQSATTVTTLAEPFVPRILSTEEFTGETVITLDLGAAHLSLASLEISADDTLYARNVTVAVRELHNGQIGERLLARGSIFQIDFDTYTSAVGQQVAINADIPARELLVHIENGDSPTLRIREIRANRTPIHTVIAPSAPGRFEILTGNTQATTPHYDLAPLSTELGQLQPTAVRISALTTNAAYRQADPLAGLPLEGATLDISPWKHQRTVNATKHGVQQIELDLHALANTQTDLADIRLMQTGKQMPYVVERTGLSRDLIFSPVEVSDPKHPSVTRWKFPLSQAGLPLSQLVIHSPTKLFERSIRFYEILKNQQGEPYEHDIATKSWTRTPNEKSQPLVINLSERMQTNFLWLETDNGDNPPLKLERLQAFFPVIRLLCKTIDDEPVDMIYGNSAATIPHYDVSLIASQLLNADRIPATLGTVQTVVPTTNMLQGANGGVLLWIVLAIVVILLLVVIAKLLPKPHSKP